MQNVEDLLKSTMTEIERVLDAKTVVGPPVTHGDTTVVPLVSVGFGFAAGGGTGNVASGDKASAKAEGGGGMGAGGGGGVKPVAVVIIEKDSVRLESIKGTAITVMEKVVDVVDKVATRSQNKRNKDSDDETGD